MADLAEEVAGLVEELRRERARADAREIGLCDAEDTVDLGRADAGAGDSTACCAVRARDERVGAVVDIEHRCLGTLEEDILASLELLVEEQRGLDDVRADALGVRQIRLADLVDRVGGHAEHALYLFHGFLHAV